MDENLARWIFASIADHFSTVASGLSLPYFVEGIDERDESTMRASHVELRVTGPFIKEVSNGYFTVDVYINFYLTKQMDIAGADAYDIIRWTGKFQDVMLLPIPIYKFGSAPADDGSLVGCINVKKGKNEAVRIYHFGQIDKDVRVRQSEVDALFGMELTT